MSSNVLLLGDCEKVDCVHILTDSLKCNTVMGSSKNQRGTLLITPITFSEDQCVREDQCVWSNSQSDDI